MKLDAHHHFWNYGQDAADYVWMGESDAALKRNFLPGDLAPLLAQAGYVGSIAVQARETARDTSFLLDLAARHPSVMGVVGWLDLCDPGVEREIEACSTNPRLKGLRMFIHDHPDPDFADSPPHARGVALLERYRLTYDLLLRPQHLEAAIRLVDRLPGQRFVVDHIAKPVIGAGMDVLWLRGIRKIAQRPNVWCKLSGLATLVPSGERLQEALAPYLDAVLEAFGPSRLMIGSDWPVCTLHADYPTVMALVETWSARLSDNERSALLGGNCAEFYRVEIPAAPSRPVP